MTEITIQPAVRRPEAVRARPPGSRALLIGLAIALAVVATISVGVGSVRISPSQVVAIAVAPAGITLPVAYDDAQAIVLRSIRMPRIVLGIVVGAALALSGAVLQGMFRNPLVDPALVGVSSGAALGAALLIVLGGTLVKALPAPLSFSALPVAAFLAALVTTAAVFRIASMRGGTDVVLMLLGGIAVNALVGAGIGVLSYVAPDAQLRQFTFWTFGGLGGANWSSLAVVVPLCALACFGLMRLARPLNALLLGESEAGHLGVSVEQVKRRAIALTALAVGAAVSVSGVISFVGLVVPHLLRLVIGPDHRALLPGSAILGALLVVAADLIARTVVSPAELPIGIVTAAVGAPCFIWLLVRTRASWGHA